MQKLAINRLKFGAKEVMDLANLLYTKGFISYPRSETNQYNSSINLKEIVEKMHNHPKHGNYAQKLTEGDYEKPANGSKSDNAHPPIYPLKPMDNSIQDFKAKQLYDLIVSHFLAQCSQNA